jgi:hypothetical protein
LNVVTQLACRELVIMFNFDVQMAPKWAPFRQPRKDIFRIINTQQDFRLFRHFYHLSALVSLTLPYLSRVSSFFDQRLWNEGLKFQV